MADVTQLAPDVEKYLAYPSSDTPTTEQEYQDFVRNMYSVSRDLIGTVRLWQPSTTYAVDEIIESPNMQPNTVAKVTSAGQSNNLEPTWAAAGEAVEDNGCQYVMVRKCQEAATAEEAAEGTDMMKIVTPAALASVLEEFEKSVISKAHPVGSIWESTKDDDPNTLWPWMTWVKMDGGRVLLSAGTYNENGTAYTYTLGQTGGEAKHTLTTGEMPLHNHDAASTNATYKRIDAVHAWTAYDLDSGGWQHDKTAVVPDSGWSDKVVSGEESGGGHKDQCLSLLASQATISHTITIYNTGDSGAHNNLVPYTVVNRWQRIA